MKYQNIKTVAFTLLMGAMLGGCKKESANIFNMFDVIVTINQDLPNSIGEEAELEPTDEVVLDYTIESPTKDMYMVSVFESSSSGSPTKAVSRVPIEEGMDRRKYSGQITIKAASKGAGQTTYRICALDEKGVYLGDGDKAIVVRVKSDFDYFVDRELNVPFEYFIDGVRQDVPTFGSVRDGEVYSYENAAANAANIDFGLYQDSVFSDPSKPEKGKVVNVRLYSLSALPNPFPLYDLSGFTNKRATLFSVAEKKASESDLRKRFSSSDAIESIAKTKNINLLEVPLIEAGNYVYFLTPEGKYGVIYILSINTYFVGEDKPVKHYRPNKVINYQVRIQR